MAIRPDVDIDTVGQFLAISDLPGRTRTLALLVHDRIETQSIPAVEAGRCQLELGDLPHPSLYFAPLRLDRADACTDYGGRTCDRESQ